MFEPCAERSGFWCAVSGLDERDRSWLDGVVGPIGSAVVDVADGDGVVRIGLAC